MKVRVTTEHEIRTLEHVSMIVIDSDDGKNEDLFIENGEDNTIVITSQEHHE